MKIIVSSFEVIMEDGCREILLCVSSQLVYMAIVRYHFVTMEFGKQKFSHSGSMIVQLCGLSWYY